MIKTTTLILKKLFGFIVIDKPAGLTSHDCVNRLRKIYGIKKIGHGGTLDPNVTGVLPIAIGDATRLISYLSGSKAYRGIIQLGTSTTTDDSQGDVIKSKSWPIISNNDLDNILNKFRGNILQKPPKFSSIHLKGERAYKKARRGDKFELPAKEIIINKLKLINWHNQKGQLEIFIDCSTGTYVRSLARDIGDLIGCGAHLKSLRRTKAFGFEESHSVLLPEISESCLENNKPKILNPKYFLKHLLHFKLDSEEKLISWRSGRKINLQINSEFIKSIERNKLNINISDDRNILVFDQNDDIAGIAEYINELTLKPKIVFNAIG